MRPCPPSGDAALSISTDRYSSAFTRVPSNASALGSSMAADSSACAPAAMCSYRRGDGTEGSSTEPTIAAVLNFGKPAGRGSQERLGTEEEAGDPEPRCPDGRCFWSTELRACFYVDCESSKMTAAQGTPNRGERGRSINLIKFGMIFLSLWANL